MSPFFKEERNMIVDPDFIDHWKTRLLVRLLGTETAPIHVIRLWAHCQARKTDRFTGWLPAVLASVCRWDGDAQVFWDAMLQTYCEMDQNDLVVHGWADVNASLISAWNNGKKGGRPKLTAPNLNPPVIPQVTQRVSDREDKIEKIREEKTEQKRERFVPPTREQLDLEAAKIGLPSIEVDKFVAYYASNGWRVGKVPMKSWPHALAGWAARWRERSQSLGLGGNRYQTATDENAPF